MDNYSFDPNDAEQEENDLAPEDAASPPPAALMEPSSAPDADAAASWQNEDWTPTGADGAPGVNGAAVPGAGAIQANRVVPGSRVKGEEIARRGLDYYTSLDGTGGDAGTEGV